MNKRALWIARVFFWAIFLWLAFLIAQNPTSVKYRISDWWRLRSYDPTEQVEELADDAQFTDEARNYFYASFPELNDKGTFNQNCAFPERAFVLGCYDGNRIYLLDVETPELEAAEPVTAAHETLHAAWARLDNDEKERLAKLLDAEYEKSDDPHLEEIINNYKLAGDGDQHTLTNELHSILATEVRDLSGELEQHYSQYFRDRSKVVDLYDSYEAVFAANEADMKRLKAQIDANYLELLEDAGTIDSKKQEIDATNAELSRLRAQGNISAYNALVPRQNALVRQYNNLIAAYNADVAAYGRLVDRYKSLSLKQTELVNAINSKSPL